jgi:hypothetical protein
MWRPAARRFNRNPRGGRRTRHRDLLLRHSGCPVFCLRQAAAAAKKQENRLLNKNKENVLYRPEAGAVAPAQWRRAQRQALQTRRHTRRQGQCGGAGGRCGGRGEGRCAGRGKFRRTTPWTFCNRVFEFPLPRRLTNAIKGSSPKNKSPRKKIPGVFFGNVLIFFPRGFELPLPLAEKHPSSIFKYALLVNKVQSKKERTYLLVLTFFGELAQMYVGLSSFVIFFSAAPRCVYVYVYVCIYR